MTAVTVDVTDDVTDDYPGRVLGLPQDGPWSVASRRHRLGAWLIDGVVVGTFALALQTMLRARFLGVTLMAVNMLVLPYLYGGSLGKLAGGMRIVPIVHRGPLPKGLRKRWLGGTAAPLADLAFWQVLVRGLQYVVWLFAAPYYFLLLLGTDSDKQTPWDLLARTVVVYSR